MPPDVIAPAAPQHLRALRAIELEAASRFRGLQVPPAMFEDATPLSVFEAAQASGHLWVALSPAGDCVGFALVEPSGHRLHLEELDVLPEHAGQGVGRALVNEVERWAVDNGFSEITLTSYRDVPWNAPFYARLGFAMLEPADLDAELVARLAAESARGLDTMPRVAMDKRLNRPTDEAGGPEHQVTQIRPARERPPNTPRPLGALCPRDPRLPRRGRHPVPPPSGARDPLRRRTRALGPRRRVRRADRLPRADRRRDRGSVS